MQLLILFFKSCIYNLNSRKKADLSGIMEIYKGGYQIFPNSMEDVAGFKVE